jgi:radical SAM protein with 4Fe4S-binding SPASM domain
MLNLTRVYCNKEQPSDNLRYGMGHGAPRDAASRRPVVVWNITQRCNLACVHCYSDSESRIYPGELSFSECRAVIEDLAQFRVPAVLLSGGEPLLHPLFFDLARHARSCGLNLTLSTNGTCITRETARKIRYLGFRYVGISLDGIGETHDQFRGKAGSFQRAVAAFRYCRAAGQKSGLRLTLSRTTVADLENILDFVESEDIRRVCFYHLVHSGRGIGLQLLQPEEIRNALDRILERTRKWAEQGNPREVLTVDQPADAAYVLMKLRREDPRRAEAAEKLLRWNGGGANSSGIGIGNIDPRGDVHPDQFWQKHTLGNVRHTPFSRIWTESQSEILRGLRNRLPQLRGNCGDCSWKTICGGGFRVRAMQHSGDPWGTDPGCYLTAEERAAA